MEKRPFNDSASQLQLGFSESRHKKQVALVGGKQKHTKHVNEATNAVIEERSKSRSDLSFINNALGKHFIFTNLTEDDREMVIMSMKHYTVNEGDVVFEQGSPAQCYFILATGKLEVQVDGKKVNTLNIGEGFGELALLHDSNRSATVIAI